MGRLRLTLPGSSLPRSGRVHIRARRLWKHAVVFDCHS
jgi:hypothetical protein